LRGRPAASALCRLARRPGVAATSLRGLTRARSASGEQQLAVIEKKPGNKKMGCSTSTPKVKAENLPLLRGLFLSAFGCLLRHFFLLRLL
jgi:hypothetical protein